MTARIPPARTAIRRFLRNDTGAGLVEFSLVILLFLFLLFAIIDFGRLGAATVSANKATQIAARTAVVSPYACLPAGARPEYVRGSSTANYPFGTSCTYEGDSDICAPSVVTPLTCQGATTNATAQAIYTAVLPLLPPGTEIENLRFTYAFDPNLGFLGGPYVPMVSVELTDVDFTFVSPLGRIAGVLTGTTSTLGADIRLPGMRVSMPGEALAGGDGPMSTDGRAEAGKGPADMSINPRISTPPSGAPDAQPAAPPAAPGAAPEAGPLLLGAPSSALLPPDAERPPEPAPKPEPAPAAGQPTLPSIPVKLPVKWEGKPGKLILVARSRGGMGATSVAVNLALELVRRHGLFRSHGGRRVAIVDLDVQFGTVGNILDIEDRGGLLELARMQAEPDLQAVRTALLRHSSGLHVLPAPRTPIPLDLMDETRVASIIDPLLVDHDFVIVDLPHALVRWFEPLLIRADRLLMVTDLAVPSVVTARRVIDLMREDNPNLTVEIVVTRERKSLYPNKIEREASAALGLPLQHWIPEEARLSRKAFDRGEPLVELAPRCPWSRALRKLAHHMETAADAAAQQTQKG